MKTLALLLAATSLALGQAPAPAPLAPGETLRVIDVKQGSASAIQNNLGSIFPGITRVNEQLIVRGQPAVVDMIEAAVKKLDVPTGEVTRSIEIKYADLNAANYAATSILRNNGNVSSAGKQMVLRGQPGLVEQAVAAIKALDAPPPVIPNVELTVQLLMGSAQEASAASVIPAELESTVRQLRALFPYQGYRVLDTQVLRTRSGQNVDASGVLPGGSATYILKGTVTVGPGSAPRSIRVDGLRFSMSQASIVTELDAREGQKTVVGKANLLNSQDAIILVITPKVIE